MPTVLSGIRENAARALATLHQAMPVRSRLHAEAFTVSSARNYWEFPAPPIDAEIVRAVGSAINRQHLVRVDYPGDGEPVAFVMTAHDRGDAAAEWQCRGSAIVALPASTVARFAPGGSTVGYDTATTCRLTLGAWSWPGLAGLLLTFDADITDIEPAELRQALHSLRTRISKGLGPD